MTTVNHNLFTQLLQRSSSDRPFLMELNGTALTYGDLVARTGGMANSLVELGIRPGDRVAVQTDKCVEAVLLYLATQRLGAIYVPFNTAYTKEELSHLLQDAAPRLLVCAPKKEAELKPLVEQIGISLVETLGPDGSGTLTARAEDADVTFDDRVCQADDLAAILYTSGTTGRSKGAMISHGNLLTNAATLAEAWRFTSQDVLLHALPIFHTHGLFVAINTVLRAGASLLFLRSFNVEEVLQALPMCSVMMGVPTFYTRLLRHERFDRSCAEHMRLFISGSAPLSAQTHAEFLARTGHEILERYGMTETNINTSNPYVGKRVPGSVGLALSGIEVRVVDADTREPLPAGKVGVIEIRGPNVFKGYWRLPEKTALDLHRDGYFSSGDLGYIDDEGYVYIVGRNKDLIISGGLNIYPAEVEGVIEQVAGVAQVAVVGVPDADFGEAPVAVVVLHPGATVTAGCIRSYVTERLAKYKCPKHIVFMDQLPINAMGKVQKNVLRTLMSNLALGDRE